MKNAPLAEHRLLWGTTKNSMFMIPRIQTTVKEVKDDKG